MKDSEKPAADILTTTDWGFWEALLAAESIALSLFAILITIFGVLVVIFGRKWAEERIEQEVAKQINFHEKELRGRMVGYVGFIFGRLSREHSELIHQAIQFSQTAYDFLPDDSIWKLKAENNLAFYYSTRGYTTDGPAAKKHAENILVGYSRTGDIYMLTTYASVVGKFHDCFENPKRTLEQAEKMMEELNEREDVTIEDKQSAARHLEAIRAALRGYNQSD